MRERIITYYVERHPLLSRAEIQQGLQWADKKLKPLFLHIEVYKQYKRLRRDMTHKDACKRLADSYGLKMNTVRRYTTWEPKKRYENTKED